MCQYLILFYLPTRFLINLVAANLLITFVLVPLILIDLIWPSIDSEYLPFYCYILRGMTTLTSSASILGKNPINYGYVFLKLIMTLKFFKNSNDPLTKLKVEKWKHKNVTLYS